MNENSKNCIFFSIAEALARTLVLPEYLHLKKALIKEFMDSRFDVIGHRLCDGQLREQAIFAVLGEDLRKIGSIRDKYTPELLVEPFLPVSLKDELLDKMSSEVFRIIDELTFSLLSSPECVKFLNVFQINVQSLIENSSKDLGSTNDRAAPLSDTIQAIFSKQGDYINSLGYIMFKRLESKYSLNISSNQIGDDIEGLKQKTHWQLHDLISYQDILSSHKLEDVDHISDKMFGYFLNSSARIFLFSYRLVFNFPDNPNKDISLVSELNRLAVIKRMPLLPTTSPSNDNAKNKATRFMKHRDTSTIPGRTSSSEAISDVDYLFNNTILQQLKLSLNTTYRKMMKNRNERENESNSFSTLIRRVSLLLHAYYIFSGGMNDRAVSIALFLLHIFPTLSPSSEIALRFFFRINDDLLPSLSLQSPRNIAIVASLVWKELRIQDIEYSNHLQNVEFHNDHEVTADAQAPLSLRVLRGWLETGFWGWFREDAVIYLWDCLILCPYSVLASKGGREKDLYYDVLIRIACVLLLLLKPDLQSLQSLSDNDLRSFCSKLRTSDIVAIFQLNLDYIRLRSGKFTLIAPPELEVKDAGIHLSTPSMDDNNNNSDNKQDIIELFSHSIVNDVIEDALKDVTVDAKSSRTYESPTMVDEKELVSKEKDSIAIENINSDKNNDKDMDKNMDKNKNDEDDQKLAIIDLDQEDEDRELFSLW